MHEKLEDEKYSEVLIDKEEVALVLQMLWTMEKITSLCLTSKSTSNITSGKQICGNLFSTVNGVIKEAYLDLYNSTVVTALKLLFLILPLPTASIKGVQKLSSVQHSAEDVHCTTTPFIIHPATEADLHPPNKLQHSTFFPQIPLSLEVLVKKFLAILDILDMAWTILPVQVCSSPTRHPGRHD